MNQKKARFPGLQLSEDDQRELKKLVRKGMLGMLKARRIRMLQLLHKGWNITSTAAAVDSHRREVRRVGWRFLEGGLDRALEDDPRPRLKPMLDSVQTAALIALACGPAPHGRENWSMALIAEEAVKRRIVKTLSRDTVRRTLARQDIKPWREKNVVRARD